MSPTLPHSFDTRTLECQWWVLFGAASPHESDTRSESTTGGYTIQVKPLIASILKLVEDLSNCSFSRYEAGEQKKSVLVVGPPTMGPIKYHRSSPPPLYGNTSRNRTGFAAVTSPAWLNAGAAPLALTSKFFLTLLFAF